MISGLKGDRWISQFAQEISNEGLEGQLIESSIFLFLFLDVLSYCDFVLDLLTIGLTEAPVVF